MADRLHSQLTLSELVAEARAPKVAPEPAESATVKRGPLPLRLLRRSSRAAATRTAPLGIALTMVAAVLLGFAGGMYGRLLVEGVPAPEPAARVLRGSERLERLGDLAPAATTLQREAAAEASQTKAMLRGLAEYQRLQLEVFAAEERLSPAARAPEAEQTPAVAPEEPPERARPRREPAGNASPRTTTRRSDRPAGAPQAPFTPRRDWDTPGYTAR
jgi:hypothetical protein